MTPRPSTATVAIAAVKVAPEETELQTFDLPEIGPDAALLRVESTGVGGSDPEQYRRATRIPSIMGHEIVGELVEIGTVAASRWGAAVGDRIALHEYLPCWHCRWCLQGDFRLCEEVDFFVVKDPLRFGMTETTVAPSLWGGYSQYVYVPGNAVVHKLPPDLPSHLATLAIPLGNGFQWAVLDGGTQVGSNVLVVGPGQQGLGCTLAAKSAGAQTVILAGHTRDATRLESGLRFGADHAVDAERDDLRSTVMRLTGGHGVDVVVDTTGDPTGEVAADAVAVAAKGATLNLNGLGQSIGIGDIKRGYFTVRAPRGHSYRSVDLALRLIASDRYPVEEMVSHRFALDQVDRAIRATAGKDVAGAIHVTVDPWS
jgi:threonine dehydrogenase-like Zn-dependent dehydrogenase